MYQAITLVLKYIKYLFVVLNDKIKIPSLIDFLHLAHTFLLYNNKQQTQTATRASTKIIINAIIHLFPPSTTSLKFFLEECKIMVY